MLTWRPAISNCWRGTPLDLDRLIALTRGHRAEHYLQLVSTSLAPTELVSWRLRKDRPRFRAETRLGQVGVTVRLIDAFAKASLLFRGRVPSGAEAVAAIADRDRPDHGDHPYYGRVVRDAGYVVLQYWYFYFFNDWRTRAHGVNDHEGDWEQVTVFLTEHDGGEPRHRGPHVSAPCNARACTILDMRTTVEFEADTAAAIERLRREAGLGVSEAVNELIRRGLLPRPDRPRFVQRSRDLGLQIDVSNVADALEILDGPDAR